MTTIVTLLPPEFADWETALINGAGRSFYDFETRYATPDGAPVTSMGGLQVTPDMGFAELDPKTFDVLLICGGEGWRKGAEVGDVAARAHAAGKVVGAICDGVWALARTGLIDARPHTGNGAKEVADSGKVAHVGAFFDPSLFATFGLPARLPAGYLPGDPLPEDAEVARGDHVPVGHEAHAPSLR